MDQARIQMGPQGGATTYTRKTGVLPIFPATRLISRGGGRRTGRSCGRLGRRLLAEQRRAVRRGARGGNNSRKLDPAEVPEDH